MPTINEPSVSQFMQDRKFLKNCTSKTLEWYTNAFRHFDNCSSQQDYENRIVQLRQRGISPTSCNSWILAINAYLRWSGAGFKLGKLKTESKILQTFSQDQITRLLAYKTKNETMRRAQVLAGLLFDTGLRIAEALSLQRSQVDLENLLITVMGKGRKERKVPISLTGRASLYRHLRHASNGPYVFSTKTGTALSIRNAQHDLRDLCRKAGITGVRCSPHTCRHSFAVIFLRGNGNLEYLRRILGHSSILVTQRYLQSIQPEDLVSKHISPLEPGRR